MKTSVDVTVIIPTFNRGDVLLEALSELARVDYPADRWEAIVVDDGSTDDTESAVRSWIEESQAPVRYIRQKNSGPAAARNRGAAEAKSGILIFIDNDIMVKPDFIRAHLETLDANPGCWVVGRIVHPSRMLVTPFGRYRNSVWESFHESHPSKDVTETDGMTAANVSMPASDFNRLGGFDEDFTIASSEDWDLGMRARQTGIRVLYNPQIKVLHNDWAVSLDRFCHRQKLYSISDVLLWQKYGESSPRARLVRENAPVNWKQDATSLVIRKMIKRVLATKPGNSLIRSVCSITEKLLPDSNWTRRAYTAAVGVAIFSGVREGLSRYGSSAPAARGPAQFEKA